MGAPVKMRWVPTRKLKEAIPKNAILVKGRMNGLHKNREEDYVLMVQEADSKWITITEES